MMAMKGGRKNLKRGVHNNTLTLQQGQSIMQVVSLRGSNLIEVIDVKGEKALAIFPAKFQKSMWIKRGNFVVVDDSGREEAVESGRKVACVVLQVLFHEQVRVLQKSPEWPEIFKQSAVTDGSDGTSQKNTTGHKDGDELNLSDDDGLPPLEANTNRRKPLESTSDTESESNSDVEDWLFLKPLCLLRKVHCTLYWLKPNVELYKISGESLGEVRMVADMHERKAEMAREADAFISLPGGYGTMEEVLEMITWSQLGIHKKPVGLLNVDGYHDNLLALFDTGVEEGFIKD